MNPALDKIALNTRTLSAPLSGVQRYVQEISRRFPVHFACLAPQKPAQGIRGHLWEQFILPFLCRGQLLFSPGNTGPLFYRRQVVTIHDASTFDCADAFTGLFGRWYRWLLPRLARRALGVITVSHFSRDRLVATLGIAPEKIAVVYNGVTPPPATPSPGALEEARTRLNLPQRFLLFVGSRDPRKNVDRLVAAFEQLDEPELHLVLAGGSNQQLFNAEQSGKTTARVQALGQVDEATLECLYHLAEGFVFPSLYEGFGLPPLEAMARGCPVICSDATCLPEVCGPAFEAGGACLYFSPLQTKSILSALQKFVALPVAERHRMTEAGRLHASQYHWARCAQETDAALLNFHRARHRLHSQPAVVAETTQGLLKKSETDFR